MFREIRRNEQEAKSWEREALVMCCLIRSVLYILYLYIFSNPQGMLKLHYFQLVKFTSQLKLIIINLVSLYLHEALINEGH